MKSRCRRLTPLEQVQDGGLAGRSSAFVREINPANAAAVFLAALGAALVGAFMMVAVLGT